MPREIFGYDPVAPYLGREDLIGYREFEERELLRLFKEEMRRELQAAASSVTGSRSLPATTTKRVPGWKQLLGVE